MSTTAAFTSDKDFLAGMYQKMLTIRLLEEKVLQLLMEGEVPDLYPCAGQEAVPVGVCAALRPQDLITGTYRGMGHMVAKGADLKPIFAELYGRKTGCCKGKGGAKHLAAFDKGVMGAYAIVGASIPIAVGLALAAKMLGKDQLVACFFGDGASNQGSFHESLNLAFIWRVPVIFVCENNLYAASTPLKTSTAVDHIAKRADGYAIKGLTIDGNDVEAVYQATKEAATRALRGEPTLLECLTYRYGGHFAAEDRIGWNYRTAEEIARWKKQDPLERAEIILKDRFGWSSSEKKMLEKGIREEIEEALEFARQSPPPQPLEALEDCYFEMDHNFLWRWPE